MTTILDGGPATPERAGSHPMSAVEVFEAGLSSSRLWAQDVLGRRRELPIADWGKVSLRGDASLLERCCGPTLDIGCGPGRLVSALASAGVEALGIDVSAAAIVLACAAGGSALKRSVFGPVPRSGRWECALLADGNIGIGGNPEALLRRVRALLAPDGLVLVELALPGTVTGQKQIRLLDGSGRFSEWFPWAELGLDAVEETAARAGFMITERWDSGGRWFARLQAKR